MVLIKAHGVLCQSSGNVSMPEYDYGDGGFSETNTFLFIPAYDKHNGSYYYSGDIADQDETQRFHTNFLLEFDYDSSNQSFNCLSYGPLLSVEAPKACVRAFHNMPTGN